MSVFKGDLKVKIFLICVLIFILFESIVLAANAFWMQSKEKELYRKSYAIQSEVEKVFLNVYTISEAYVSYIEESPEVSRLEVEGFLSHLLSHEENYIRNIAYVEGTVIKFNFPYEENKGSVGIDLGEIPGQMDDVAKVEELREPLFKGPLELVQGGRAFILRIPVIVGDDYFGHVSTVIDADIFEGLIEKEAELYNVELTLGYLGEENFITIGDDFDDLGVETYIVNKYTDWEMNVYDLSVSNLEVVINYGIRLMGLSVILIVVYYVLKNEKLIREVKYKASHDSLTENYNRLKFTDDFEKGAFVGKLVAFMDINKFKILNDTLGHRYGDWVLGILSEEFKSTGKFHVYRNSGDEFFLVSKEPMTIKDMLIYTKNFEYLFFHDELKHEVDITLSVGVIEKVTSHLDYENMLMYLDYAMYDAKNNRRILTIVDKVLMGKYNAQTKIEQFLIDDIQNDRFLLYYQPIIDMVNKRIESIEVLSRWEHNGEIIAASMFIDIVKRIRYIERVDQNLIKNLQRDYSIFTENCKEVLDINFSINLSADILKDFERNNSKFDSYTENLQIPHNRVIFEISEDTNLGLISEDTINYIQSKGFNVVIDDFGSGVSKLSDVLSGKLLAIKTDKSMLPSDLSDSHRLKGFNTIVKAISATESKVCVEGVENIDQLRISHNAGCDLVQGFYFARPMPLEDIIEYVQNFDYSKFESEYGVLLDKDK